jgi:hypothetical protein
MEDNIFPDIFDPPNIEHRDFSYFLKHEKTKFCYKWEQIKYLKTKTFRYQS